MFLSLAETDINALYYQNTTNTGQYAVHFQVKLTKFSCEYHKNINFYKTINAHWSITTKFLSTKYIMDSWSILYPEGDGGTNGRDLVRTGRRSRGFVRNGMWLMDFCPGMGQGCLEKINKNKTWLTKQVTREFHDEVLDRGRVDLREVAIVTPRIVFPRQARKKKTLGRYLPNKLVTEFYDEFHDTIGTKFRCVLVWNSRCVCVCVRACEGGARASLADRRVSTACARASPRAAAALRTKLLWFSLQY